LEKTSEMLITIETKTTPMKAALGITRSKRRHHRINLHENDIDSKDLAYYDL